MEKKTTNIETLKLHNSYVAFMIQDSRLKTTSNHWKCLYHLRLLHLDIMLHSLLLHEVTRETKNTKKSTIYRVQDSGWPIIQYKNVVFIDDIILIVSSLSSSSFLAISTYFEHWAAHIIRKRNSKNIILNVKYLLLPDGMVFNFLFIQFLFASYPFSIPFLKANTAAKLAEWH